MLRRTVFDSTSEASVFKALDGAWEPEYRVYPQLPLSKIFSEPPKEATAAQRGFFLKTNVDFTLCTADGRPILSVEFDGIGGGFSKDGVYSPKREVVRDPHRKAKLDFKLALARNANYPFLVAGYEEVEALEAGETLTVLHGIVGSELARLNTQSFWVRDVAERQEELSAWTSEDRDEALQDMLLGAEVEADMKYKVFEKPTWRMRTVLENIGILESIEVRHFTEPPLPPTRDLFDFEMMLARQKAMEAADIHRARATLRLRGSIPAVIRTIALRPVSGSWLAYSLSGEIALYLALRHAVSLLPPDVPREADNFTEGHKAATSSEIPP